MNLVVELGKAGQETITHDFSETPVLSVFGHQHAPLLAGIATQLREKGTRIIDVWSPPDASARWHGGEVAVDVPQAAHRLLSLRVAPSGSAQKEGPVAIFITGERARNAVNDLAGPLSGVMQSRDDVVLVVGYDGYHAASVDMFLGKRAATVLTGALTIDNDGAWERPSENDMSTLNVLAGLRAQGHVAFANNHSRLHVPQECIEKLHQRSNLPEALVDADRAWAFGRIAAKECAGLIEYAALMFGTRPVYLADKFDSRPIEITVDEAFYIPDFTPVCENSLNVADWNESISGSTRQSQKTGSISLRLNEDLIEAIDAIAEQSNTTRTDIIEKAIVESIAPRNLHSIEVSVDGEPRWFRTFDFSPSYERFEEAVADVLEAIYRNAFANTHPDWAVAPVTPWVHARWVDDDEYEELLELENGKVLANLEEMDDDYYHDYYHDSDKLDHLMALKASYKRRELPFPAPYANRLNQLIRDILGGNIEEEGGE